MTIASFNLAFCTKTITTYLLAFATLLTEHVTVSLKSPLIDYGIYNTTSGLYMAEPIELDGYGFDESPNLGPMIVHKLTSVPYGEKPGRFQQSRMKEFERGIHFLREHVSCCQSVNLSSYGAFNLNQAPTMTEDCLTLNLYIPVGRQRLNNSGAKLYIDNEHEFQNMSVVVHIHGGSNMVGGSGLFDGSILAAHGRVIVAVINYRLSILGFLSDMTPKYPGNYGLRDQLLAIKWLKLNCPQLRCNPNSITLWGHSAGAGDVNWLALSPLSNTLFQRVIIQSGSSFSYWGFDKHPHERYKALRAYFNCTSAPAEYTPHNGAMTKLIDDCLLHTPLEDLFSFKFALIDAPGPIYDGFLGPDKALIHSQSPKEMLLDDRNGIYNLDIMSGINGVEGFSFEGYFADSVRFWAGTNLTSEVALTMERISLLTRERCMQNSIIGNRLKFEKFYENKVRKYIRNESELQTEEARRLKSIFANSDAIFDSGFVEFLNLIATKKVDMMRRGLLNKSNLFVYEYLHENSGSQVNLTFFKRFLQNYSLSTHFDGIDFLFGLPLAFKNRRQIKKNYNSYPFREFALEGNFSDDDVALSLSLMKYYSNFIKNGNPNIGSPVPKSWESYVKKKAYLVLDKSLSEKKLKLEVAGPKNNNNNNQDYRQSTTVSTNSPAPTSYYGIREDLYNFWFVELEKNGQCSAYEPRGTYARASKYESGRHTSGRDPGLDRCLAELDRSKEYNYLREMFLIEYEYCINMSGHPDNLRSLFNTVCLDIIAIRRMLIEYDLCCLNSRGVPNITSTICSFKNFNTNFINYKLIDLINYVVSSASNASNSSGHIINSQHNDNESHSITQGQPRSVSSSSSLLYSSGLYLATAAYSGLWTLFYFNVLKN